MLQSLSKEIRQCYERAEQCRRAAETAAIQSAKDDFLDIEKRWLSLARSYEFAERLSSFTAPFRKRGVARSYPASEFRHVQLRIHE
jgi:hypothetical protein